MVCARRVVTLKDAVRILGAKSGYVVCDVSDEASVDQAIATTMERFGHLDCAVNSAGTAAAGPFTQMQSAEFDACMKTNLYGVFYCMRAQANAMSEGGSIVNIGSLAGSVTHPWLSGYCASKAAVSMLSKCAADELGQRGVRVNVVEPGGVQTEMAAPLFETAQGRAEYLENMPISRLGKPEDVASMVGFLLSEEAGWITGEVIAVDGGHHLRRGPNLERSFAPEA